MSAAERSSRVVNICMNLLACKLDKVQINSSYLAKAFCKNNDITKIVGCSVHSTPDSTLEYFKILLYNSFFTHVRDIIEITNVLTYF